MRRHREAKSEEDVWLNKCEALYPRLAYGRPCAVCLSKWDVTDATHIKLIVETANVHLRFFLENMMPVCDKHKNAKTEELPVGQKTLNKLKKINTKNTIGICIAKGITKTEMLKSFYYKMKELIL